MGRPKKNTAVAVEEEKDPPPADVITLHGEDFVLIQSTIVEFGKERKENLILVSDSSWDNAPTVTCNRIAFETLKRMLVPAKEKTE